MKTAAAGPVRVSRTVLASAPSPSCGGGSGWGVVPRGTVLLHSSTPTPDPSPQGGGEQNAAPYAIALPARGGGRVAAGARGPRIGDCAGARGAVRCALAITEPTTGVRT